MILIKRIQRAHSKDAERIDAVVARHLLASPHVQIVGFERQAYGEPRFESRFDYSGFYGHHWFLERSRIAIVPTAASVKAWHDEIRERDLEGLMRTRRGRHLVNHVTADIARGVTWSQIIVGKLAWAAKTYYQVTGEAPMERTQAAKRQALLANPRKWEEEIIDPNPTSDPLVYREVVVLAFPDNRRARRYGWDPHYCCYTLKARAARPISPVRN